jgi:hypothetical protein
VHHGYIIFIFSFKIYMFITEISSVMHLMQTQEAFSPLHNLNVNDIA